MNDVDEKLISCFRAVFPKKESEQIRQASMNSMDEWDSMVTITLVALIEETFGIQTGSEDIGELTSFERIRNYVQKKAVVCDTK